jgi:hypothetical protein
MLSDKLLNTEHAIKWERRFFGFNLVTEEIWSRVGE